MTPKQRKRLEKLQSEIRLNQITVSFSLEERFIPGRDGRKMSAFYSANAVRDGSEGSWTIEEARLAECILSRHVVETVYRDAIRRGILTQEAATNEATGILHRYNLNIRRLVKNGDDDDS